LFPEKNSVTVTAQVS